MKHGYSMNGFKKIQSIALSKANTILDRVHSTLDNRSIEVLVDEDIEKHLKNNKKTILYVGIRYDYGNKDWGLSYEHYNFYHTLLNMGYSLIYFDYDRINQKYDIKKMSEMLREAVYYYHPDILFYFNFHDWIKHSVWKEISNELQTRTIIWLSDDHWRYEETKPIWELFNLIVTTDRKGYEKRMKEGFDNVLLSQWGCNHFLYRKSNLPKIYDVSFVGRCYGERENFVDTLKRNGINIATFGQGWENGSRVSQADLIRIYNQSKICLNISFASQEDKIQIKGRDFEAPGCGSLLLTKDTEEIAEYFVPGEEIITYQDADDAAEKIKYYLKNEDKREKIAKNGYGRVMKEHTIEKRFLEISEFGRNKS
jgi:spore maturation protein CgeB